MPTSCRSRPAWHRRTARRGRSRGTPGGSGSSSRPCRPCRHRGPSARSSVGPHPRRPRRSVFVAHSPVEVFQFRTSTSPLRSTLARKRFGTFCPTMRSCRSWLVVMCPLSHVTSPSGNAGIGRRAALIDQGDGWLQSGRRFSRKACIPIWRVGSVRTGRSTASAMSANASSRLERRDAVAAAPWSRGRHGRHRRESRRRGTRPCAATSSVTWVTSPIDRASSASNGSPVSIAAAILLAGTRRRIGTEMIAAATPIRTSVSAKVVARVDDDEVARRHQSDPAGSDGTVDGGDRRAVGVHQPFEQRRRTVWSRRAVGTLLQIGARTERRSFVAEHDRPRVGRLGRVERIRGVRRRAARDSALRLCCESIVIVATSVGERRR